MRNPILDLSTDDFTGLWEIVWRGRSLAPDASDDEIRSAARRDACALISEGLLSVYRGTRFGGDEVQLSSAEALALIEDDQSWEPPESTAEHLRVATTEAGERAYRKS
jgi:hypothetical protein